MAAMGCKEVTLTDLAEVCPITLANRDANLEWYAEWRESVRVRPLCWGTDDWRAAITPARSAGTCL